MIITVRDCKNDQGNKFNLVSLIMKIKVNYFRIKVLSVSFTNTDSEN
jgi:hypothetical protein